MSNELEILAHLLMQRAVIDNEIAGFIGYPAHSGHIGEYIASRIFDIELNQSASQRATDGAFRSGPLAGRSVNIKLYSRSQSLLDIVESDDLAHHPDLYLVMAGPRTAVASSKKTSSPITIAEVYLFDATTLIPSLIASGVKRGIATSVRTAYWNEAMIYPMSHHNVLTLTPEQSATIALFTLAPGA